MMQTFKNPRDVVSRAFYVYNNPANNTLCSYNGLRGFLHQGNINPNILASHIQAMEILCSDIARHYITQEDDDAHRMMVGVNFRLNPNRRRRNTNV